MKWILICFLLLSACKTSRSPLAYGTRENSSNFDMRLTTIRSVEKTHQISAMSGISGPCFSKVLLNDDTPPPIKENPRINPQNVDSLKSGDQEASNYNRHQSGSRFVDTLEDLWDAGGMGKDAILLVLLFIFAGIYVLIFGPMNQ